MKNYLISSLYKIKSPMWFHDRSGEGDIYEHYMKMHALSLQSFKDNLAGEWEFIFFNKEVDNIQSVFKDHFFEIYDIWKQGNCNILYCGPDNLMMKPTTIFGQYDDFRMFNYTDPKALDERSHYNIDHPHFFNADVRYYPASMDQAIWDLGAGMTRNWDFNCWNTEQIILNHMLWSQEGRTLENTLDPTMAYQAQWLFAPQGQYAGQWSQRLQVSNQWNNCDIRDAHIVHLHGSRDAPSKYQLMSQLKELVTPKESTIIL